MPTMNGPSTGGAGSRPGGPLAALLRPFSSITLGIWLLALLFLYSSIGSAGVIYPTAWNLFDGDAWHYAQMRQWRPFEMTEFEWFHWWPFNLLMGLICLNIVVATWKRIPLRRVNYGVWAIHAGILVLCLGSTIYFTTKIEGDAPVARRRVVVQLPGATTDFPAVPGARATLDTPDGPWNFTVQSVDPHWAIRSGDDTGRSAYSVTVAVDNGRTPFMRQLLAGYPDYTEDIVRTDDPAQPMKRAVKALGKPLVDETLAMTLDYDPQDWVYLANWVQKSWALYVRERGTQRWYQRPVDGLPLYNDYVASFDDVWLAPGSDLPLDPLDVRVPPFEAGDPLPGDLVITSYLRYAQLETRSVPDDEHFNPAASVLITGPDGSSSVLDLAAADTQAAADGLLRLSWAETPEERTALATGAAPLLTFIVPAAGVTRRVTLTPELLGSPTDAWTPIEGTPYSYRVKFWNDSLLIDGQHQVALASILLRTPERTWERWVFEQSEFTHDLALPDADHVHEAGEAESGAHGGERLALDPGVVATYRPARRPAPYLLVAGPGEDDLALLTRDSEELQPIRPGESLPLGGGVELHLRSYSARSVRETRPAIVPPEERERDVREEQSMVKVAAPASGLARSVWVSYHTYPVRDVASTLRRYRYRPTSVPLADGRVIEVVLSRKRVPLPASVVLEDFELTTNVGGFSGRTSSIRNWTSLVRFAGPGGLSDPVAVSVNEPVEHDGYWFFQSQWDPPMGPRFEGDPPSAGLNYTVLGVGNRHGVGVQLLGCCIAVAGMLYAFYVKPLLRRRPAGKLVRNLAAAALLALALPTLSGCGAEQGPDSPFARAVDLQAFGRVAVHHEGRLKSFDSYARTLMDAVSGSKSYRGQSPGFTLLDLMFRPEAYADADILYVKNKPMRAQIVKALQGTHAAHDPGFGERMDRFVEQGLISDQLLRQPAVLRLLETLRRDLMRTARFVEALDSAAFVMGAGFLEDSLCVVPPPGGDAQTPWLPLHDVMQDDLPALAGLDAALRDELRGQYDAFSRAWRAQDAPAVNAASVRLAAGLAQVDPALYPSRDRLAWESWYFRSSSMTWVWLLYLPAVIVLLMALVYRWTAARRIGMGLFLLAFGFHTFAVGLRWYVAGRWPNSNMFEAVTTAAWFGCVCALVLEWIVRRNAMRNLFALGSAVAAMVALMAVHFMPATLTPAIGNMMPVLHDVWLYIHTNVIIASYCLIFMAAVSALCYLVWRALGNRAEAASLGGAGTLIAGRLDEAGTDGRRVSAGQVLDGVTMVLMELSFVMLWAGLVMGAIWADHSWGRPWGWDPKEVFALNTFLIFAVLVHVRFRARDKGLWTALLAVTGAGVMLFNWIVINFVITGLHSYA